MKRTSELAISEQGPEPRLQPLLEVESMVEARLEPRLGNVQQYLELENPE